MHRDQSWRVTLNQVEARTSVWSLREEASIENCTALLAIRWPECKSHRITRVAWPRVSIACNRQKIKISACMSRARETSSSAWKQWKGEHLQQMNRFVSAQHFRNLLYSYWTQKKYSGHPRRAWHCPKYCFYLCHGFTCKIVWNGITMESIIQSETN